MSYSNEEETVSSVDELYDVGTFVQIMEVHDMKDKMRMIIQGHRRSEETIPVFAQCTVLGS